MSIGTTSPFVPSGVISLSAGKISTSNRLGRGNEPVVLTDHTASVTVRDFSGDRSSAVWAADIPEVTAARQALSDGPPITYAAPALNRGSDRILFRCGDGPIS
jgi:hypothetical protein